MQTPNPSDSVASTPCPISIDQEFDEVDTTIVPLEVVQNEKKKKLATCMNEEFDSIGSRNDSISAYDYYKEAVKDMTAKMILVHDYPFMMVEHDWFRNHSKMLNPEYEPVDHLDIIDRALKLYEDEKIKIRLMFANAGKISLTSDLWISNQTKGYMCITGQFLDTKWKLQNRILNFCSVPPPLTGVAIAEKMYECLLEWGIEDKISTITFDDASSNYASIQSLKKQFQERDALYFGGKILHIRCCVHILNLLVQDGLIPLKVVIENVREGVKSILLSPSRLQEWNKVVQNMSLPTNETLILDCVTQLNSTFHMLERALIYKEALTRFAVIDPSCFTLPSEEEWGITTDVCKLLSTFVKVIDIFSSGKYATANLYFPEIWEIKLILDDVANDPRDFMKLTVQSMKEKFDKYWKECNLFLIIAAVLDPRNKIDYIEFSFEKLYEKGEIEERIATVKNELHILYDEYVVKETSGHNDDMAGRMKNGAHSWRVKFEKWVKSTCPTMPAKKELDIYLEECVLMGSGNEFDVLEWWKAHTLRFPTLSKMARDILSIPATIVPIETALTTPRRVVADDRCCFGDITMEGLICAANWFQAELDVPGSGDEGLLDWEDTFI